MKTKDKIILKGIFQSFDNDRNRHHLYYTRETFEKHINELKHKMLLKSRKEKIDRIKNK